MKKWNEPEMNVFSIRMNENIAASGDAGGTGGTGTSYETVKLYVTPNGVITREAGYYHCIGTQIQDTGVHYTSSITPYFWESDTGTVSGCIA